MKPPKLTRIISGHKKAPARKPKCAKYSDDQGLASQKKKGNGIDDGEPNKSEILRHIEERQEEQMQISRQNAYVNSFKTKNSTGLPILVHLGPLQLEQAQHVADNLCWQPVGLFDVVDAAVDTLLAHFLSFPESTVSKSFLRAVGARKEKQQSAEKRIEKDKQKNRDTHARRREDQRKVRDSL